MTDEYEDLRQEFNRVYDSKEYKARRERMSRHLKEFKGEWWGELKENDSKIFANFLFATIESIVPLLTDNKPIWYARARYPERQGIMEMWRGAAECAWDKLDCDQKLYQVIQDACLWPVGLWKLYWNTEEDELAIEVDDPQTFALAEGYDDLWGAAWCGTKTSRPMSWVKSFYPEAEVEPDGGNESVRKDLEDGDYVTVYEMWIKDDSMQDVFEGKDQYIDGIKTEEVEYSQERKYPNGRIVIMTESEVLEDKPSMFSHGKPPWIAFYDYRVPHSFWGMGEADQIEELNRELNLRLQTVVKHAQRNQNGNYVIDNGSGLNPEEVKAEMDEGGNVWAVNSGYVDNAIRQVPTERLNDMHIQLMQMIPQIMEEVTGVTDISKGMASKKERQSASEVSILIESSYTRTRQRVRNLEWALKRAYYLIIELMQQFYTEPRPFTMQEPDGRTAWAYASNDPETALEATKPMRKPKEQEEEYQMRVAGDRDYNELLKAISAKPDPVYSEFDIEIQTNSTLPMDKQAQANLMLKLAGVRPQPDSIVDAEAVLDALHIPNKEEIMKRKQRQMQQAMAAKLGGQGGGRPSPGAEQVNSQPR